MPGGFFNSVIPDDGEQPAEIDVSVAHQARVYDYLLGGKTHFAADREVGDKILQANPDMVAMNRANRAFLGRAVRFVANEAGIRQFLDIGTGIPSAGNTHEVAQEVAPESRIVYVDNDPIVLAHARALLASAPEGKTAYLEADANDPDTILERAAQTLDFTKPVAITMLYILQVIRDPYALTSRLLRAVPDRAVYRTSCSLCLRQRRFSRLHRRRMRMPCLCGTRFMHAICRGGNLGCRLGRCSLARSCCSRHPSAACCPHIRPGSRGGLRPRRLLLIRLARRCGSGGGLGIPGGHCASMRRPRS